MKCIALCVYRLVSESESGPDVVVFLTTNSVDNYSLPTFIYMMISTLKKNLYFWLLLKTGDSGITVPQPSMSRSARDEQLPH